MKTALLLENVSKKIHQHTVLSNISMNVCVGAILGIQGRNASGKSMLFKAISGLIRVDEGTISIFGHDNMRVEALEKIGVLIEYPSFLPNFDAASNLMMLANLRRKIVKKDVYKMLERVGLNPHDKRPFKKYSLGMRQKLGIAASIMESPDLLILDEPFNNLDTESVIQIRNLLKDIHNHQNTTILLSSHNADDIKMLCTEICTIANGKLEVPE